MDRSPGGASPSSMNLSTFLGGSSPSPGGGSASNFYQNFASPSAIPASAASSAGSQQYSTSMSIRHEIQRFESVHPSIYAIYDLIKLIPSQLLTLSIHPLHSFVNLHIVLCVKPVWFSANKICDINKISSRIIYVVIILRAVCKVVNQLKKILTLGLDNA